MNKKYTPAPWHCGIWDGNPEIIEIYAVKETKIGSDKIEIAEVKFGDAFDETAIPDANLIATAPELLEVLEEIVNHKNNDDFNLHGEHEMWDKARAVIAKASSII